MLVELFTGNETFETGTVTIYAFYRKNATQPELGIEAARGDPHSGLRFIGSPTWLQACSENRNHGHWVITRCQVSEFSFIKVMIRRKLPGQFIPRSKGVYLYNRATAANRRIRIPLTGDTRATRSVGYFEGRFDVLRFDQLERLGIVIPENMQAIFQIDDFSELFDDHILENEAEPLILPTVQTIATATGRQVRIARIVSKRKIKI